jgi:hypothetical protein
MTYVPERIQWDDIAGKPETFPPEPQAVKEQVAVEVAAKAEEQLITQQEAAGLKLADPEV